ncbi:MAG TPA: glycoside hydrolase family 15 protein [Acidimicrobiales bacterium]|nr:glycoside hydrolase family 15 protein [Acidimicrobiales bacterium]
MLTDAGRVPLNRRGWIGDGRHGASVTADGTVDWYSSAGLTAGADLWRLLDPSGAAVRVGPVRDGSGVRRRLPVAHQTYREATNVLETVIEGPAGRRVAVVDFMPWPGPGLDPPGGVVRLVRALSGPVRIEVEVLPGARPAEVAPSARGLIVGRLEVTAPAPFVAAPLGRDEERWRAVLELDAGQEAVVTVGRRDQDLPGSESGAHRALADTEAAWRSWLTAVVYAGPHQAALQRALLSVRMLTGPGGAPHAAGTSSLPRRPGSERSADDRWVRLRDAARAARVLAGLGLAEDGEAAERWMRETLTTADLPWPAWFDADGQPVPPAEEWPFPGWRGNGPVRRGRPALDADTGLVGEVVAAVGSTRTGPRGRPDDAGPLSAAWAALAGATDRAADDWRRPDPGRWEIGRPPRMYVAGRLGVWAALDRMARLARAANPLDLQAATWQQESREVLAWLEGSGPAADGGLRMDGASPLDEADAALLAVAWQGPWPVTHPVVTATVDRVLQRLGSDLVIHRYSDRVADDRAGPDHPDLEASLMAVRALARLGRWEEAHERLESVLTLTGSGPGLLPETVDPVTAEGFGNFPATGTALAFLEAAAALENGPR